MSSKQAKSFLLIILVPIILIALFNWVIDPYEIFGSTKWSSINEVKIARQGRLLKALEIAYQKPDIVFLGSSRPMCGMDPSYFVDQKTYNACFEAANMEEIAYFFDHALYYQPHLKRVIIGLDFFAFGKGNLLKKDFNLAYLQAGTLNIEHRLSLLFSKLTLIHSYRTLLGNWEGYTIPPFLENGMYHPLIADSKYNGVLAVGDLEFLRQVLSSSDNYGNYQLDRTKVESFRKIAEKCAENGIELEAYFCPSKAIYWEALYRHGLWPVLEELKRRLVEIHPIWDFSGFNCVTTQSIETTEMPLYYECSHFRPLTGKLILDRLFQSPQAVQEFGHYLTLKNIEEGLEKIREERQKWIKSQPSAYEALNAVILSEDKER